MANRDRLKGSLILIAVAGGVLYSFIDFITDPDWGALEFWAFVFGCLVLLALGLTLVPKKVAQISAGLSDEELQAAWQPKGRPIVVMISALSWIGSIVCGPFVGWIVAQVCSLTLSNWRLQLGIRLTLTAILPLVCVLPMLRFVRGPFAHLMLLILAVGTLFAVTTGLEADIDLVRGPVWETVTVSDVLDDSVKLSDGRELDYSEEAKKDLKVLLHYGRMDILVLRASGAILDAR